MKQLKFLAIAIGLLAFTSCTDEPNVKDEQTEKESAAVVENQEEPSYVSSLGLSAGEKDIVADNNMFAWKFFAKNCDQEAGNVVVSPLSVSIAMTMLANGASEGGEVQGEILNTLGYAGTGLKDVNSAAMKLADGISRLDEEVELVLANSFWVKNQKLSLNPSYTSILEKSFFAESYPIVESSFVADVNRWSDQKTKGMINDILRPDTEAPDVALINATYFKGLWSENYAFDKEKTVKGQFNNLDASSSEADFMTATNCYPYFRNETLEAVEIPFGKGKYCFSLIKPTEGKTLKDCVSEFANGKLSNLFAAEQNDGKLLEVKLPRFDVRYDEQIKGILSDMGMQKAMNCQDYFFAAPQGLCVDKILHGAHFRINEDGAEAAAVTVILEVTTSTEETEPQKPQPFYLDSPFIYLITEKESGAILFLGCINKL